MPDGADMQALRTLLNHVKQTAHISRVYVHACYKIVKSCELTFTRLDALAPRVIKFCVAEISAVLEPITTGSTTTRIAVFIGAALQTYHDVGLCYWRQCA